MNEFFEFTCLDYFLISTALLAALYFYLTKNFDFFEKHGIAYEKKPYPIFGSMLKMMFKRESFYELSQRAYIRSKENNGLSGIFDQSKPVVVVSSPDLVKMITVKDFDHFMDHRTIDFGGIFDKNLFNLKGLRWKNMRTAMSPSFTSSKLRFIYESIHKCAQQIDIYLLKEMKKQKAEGKKEIIVEQEVKQFFTRFTNDAIAASVYGIEVDSFADPKNEFFLMGKDVTDLFSGLRWVKLLLAAFNPFLYKLFFSEKSVFSEKSLNYFTKLASDNIEKRRKEKIVRPDMINLLLEAQATKKDYSEDITDNDIIAQAIVFFFAGFDTISTTLAIAAHQLAEFPEVQEKLHQEIDQKFKETNGAITYDILMKDMPYLDMVLDETQRRLPAAPFTERICTKSYTLPSTDNRQEYTINRGEQIWVPVYGFHRDAEYFPEPDKFIPERWSDKTQHNANVFMPFGVGPRMCIANRFARMETKLALLYILKNCKLVFTEKTENPIKFISRGLAIQNEKGFWLGLKPRHNN